MNDQFKKLTCIECPKGCSLTVETDEQGRVIRVSGNQCEKGARYGRTEAAAPMRVLTSTVLTRGLALKMLPVRTSKPIPRARIQDAMRAVKKIRVAAPVQTGDVIAENFLSLGVDLIATRNLGKNKP